jgi:hypothetical protein
MKSAIDHIRDFGEIVGRLIRKDDISRAEARECWRQTLRHLR